MLGLNYFPPEVASDYGDPNGCALGIKLLVNKEPALGLHRYLLMLDTKGTNKQLRKDVYDFCKNHPHIIAQMECHGSWDFEISIAVEDSIKLRDIEHELYERFGSSLDKIRSYTCLACFKSNRYPFDLDDKYEALAA